MNIIKLITELIKKKGNKMKKEGEIYIVDEIGDDEKYVFLTRESDGEVFQEFDITDELYNELLNNHDEVLKIKYENGAYKIVDEQ